MSSVTAEIVLEKEQRTISKTGGTLVFYLPSKAREYMKKGDSVDCQLVAKGNKIIMIVTKQLYKFGLIDIKKLANDCKLTIQYDKKLGDVTVFEAIKNNFSLSYTQDRRGKILPANVTLATKLSNVDYSTYERANTLATQLKKKLDVIVRSEGDLDTINILKEPERYKLDIKKAFSLLKKGGKKMGLSIIVRFDNIQNNLDEIKTTLDELKQLDSKLRS